MPRNPLDNSEVATKVNLPWIWALGREYEGERGKIWAFAPKPNIRGSLGAYWPYKIKL